jgi:hypothetical protein
MIIYLFIGKGVYDMLLDGYWMIYFTLVLLKGDQLLPSSYRVLPPSQAAV